MNKPTLSFEFFPPKNDSMAEVLWDAVPKLAALDPKYMTVTYGAGGSTRDGTVDTLKKMMALHDIPMAAHLTFINTTKDELKAYTDGLWDMGVRHIIALRGDMPPDTDVAWPLDADDNYFQYTSDFVEGLKGWHDFEISVGCYPEKHPDAPSLDADIEALKKKCDAGADRAITQFFFNNDDYYAFVEKVRAAGITTPICPGLLPIYDFKSMTGFAKRCQAHVPSWMRGEFAGTEDKPEEALKVSEELLVTQALDLAEQGVEHLHVYSMNKAPLSVALAKSLQEI
jgi:methylenetetrahydrofolate reductase (NADPH)